MASVQTYYSLISPSNLKVSLKIFTSYLLTILLLAAIAFSTGYAVACSTVNMQSGQTSQESIQSPDMQQQKSVSFPLEISNTEESRNITIIFTVDEQKRIHIIQISGGYNLLTDYIKKSLEGKVLESENAVPGINYVMTVKFPSTV